MAEAVVAVVADAKGKKRQTKSESAKAISEALEGVLAGRERLAALGATLQTQRKRLKKARPKGVKKTSAAAGVVKHVRASESVTNEEAAKNHEELLAVLSQHQEGSQAQAVEAAVRAGFEKHAADSVAQMEVTLGHINFATGDGEEEEEDEEEDEEEAVVVINGSDDDDGSSKSSSD